MQKKILIVDGDRESARLKMSIFNMLNFDAELAYDGIEALLKARDGGIDIIISDTPMSEISGEVFVDTIKGDDSTKDIPIILIAPFNLMFKKMEFKERGVSDYIVKPVNMEELINRVNRVADNNSLKVFYSAN